MAQLVAMAALASALAAGAHRDVPKGYCHNCEVTCFEDCAAKYDREIIIPDLYDTIRLSRKETRIEGELKKQNSGMALLAKHQMQTGPTTETMALVKRYGSCLETEQCPCNREGTARQGLQLIARKTNRTRCAVGEKTCAVGCFDKALESSFLQADQFVRPEPKEDAAIPWSISVHPVKINTFATGRQTLEQCFKSCLAATCGCDDAPGMEAIEDLEASVAKNHQAQDPVEDTPPAPQYRKAEMAECAKGMPGKKITSGLYIDFGGGPSGWVEVCSAEFFTGMGKSADAEIRNCANSKALLAGCLWDEVKSECVYGMNKMLRCFTRYYDDDAM